MHILSYHCSFFLNVLQYAIVRKSFSVSLNLFSLCTADAYNHTDSEFLKSENSQNRDAGSTASTAILVGDRLLVANVGDSRAVICRGGNGKSHKYYLFIYLCMYFCRDLVSISLRHLKA